MTKEALLQWAKEVAEERKITLGEILYSPAPNHGEDFRNVIFDATWNNQPAVLKMYDDHRLIHESESLVSFHKRNTCATLTAPKLFDSGIIDHRRGWVLMERMPNDSQRFSVPMSDNDREKFLDIFVDYRTHFPTTPDRPLNAIEQLSSAEFQKLRLHRWYERAALADVERKRKGQPETLPVSELLPLYYSAMNIVSTGFANRPMIWCHGHFKPQEVFIINGRPYITDFGHMSMFPEGYELGFIIWADYLTTPSRTVLAAEWIAGLESWIEAMITMAKKLHYQEPEQLVRASVVERLLGTILADVCAREFPLGEIKNRLVMLMPALEKLVR